jgi:tRNA U34 5-carboxymethylaminomethyl modifying GTPase MnmE/TrmE
MPASAARFYTVGTGGSAAAKFFAVGVIDADATANQTHDWSYSLVPESYPTDKFVVAWGPGADNVTRSLVSTDLNGSPVWLTTTENTNTLQISAKKGVGLEALRAHILQLAGWQTSAQDGVFTARARHLEALAVVLQHLVVAEQMLSHAQPALDLLAEECRLAQQALSSLTGEFSADDLLGDIFSNFCIGK